jgi:hypothetical protein
LWLLVWVTVTSPLPPPLSFTSQVKVLPFSFLTPLGQEADVICVVEVDSDELSIPCSALLASTVSSLPHAESTRTPTATAKLSRNPSFLSMEKCRLLRVEFLLAQDAPFAQSGQALQLGGGVLSGGRSGRA